MWRPFVLLLTLPLTLLLAGCATTSPAQMAELRHQAEQGNPDAQFHLGAELDNGPGDMTHDVEAVVWYQKAAEQGHAEAQNSLGSMYFLAQGVPEDDAEAVKWYRKAVEQDHGEAYTNLGYMYDFGLGVAQDKPKAVELYQRGAEKGSPTAMLNLGVAYWKGEGIARDLVQACKWLDLARFYTQRSSDMRLKWRVRGTLDQVKKEMTAVQIREAMKLGNEWDAAHRPQ